MGHIARNCFKKKKSESSLENSTSQASANHASMLMVVMDTALIDYQCCHHAHCHITCAVHKSFDMFVDETYSDNYDVDPTVGTPLISSSRNTDDRLLLDSGASGHMVRRHDWFTNKRSIQPKSIFVGNEDVVVARRSGDIKLRVRLSNRRGADGIVRTIIICDVLYVPDLAINLISCSQLCQNEYDIKFNGRRGRAMLNSVIEF